MTDLPMHPNSIALFEKEGLHYRIPAMICTKSGRLVACADERFFGGGDNPNRIDKVIRISDDGGNTWKEPITAVAECGSSKNAASAAVDPALLYDESRDVIFMLYSHTPAGVGILNCATSRGVEGDMTVLRCGSRKYLLRDGQIFTARGKRTQYTVDTFGNLSHDLGNIKDGSGKFKEEPTSFLMLTQSADGGETWSAPVCLNRMVKNPSWGFIGAGPGVGIRIKNGAYAGRLVFPVYYGVRKYPPNCTNAAIYSDDGGKTWDIGETPVVPMKYGKRNPKYITYTNWLTESQIVELPDGTLLNFIRNHHKCRQIATATSTDGGKTWQNYAHHPQLPHCICQIAAIAFTAPDDTFTIVTVNAADQTARKKGVVRISEDGGKTFPYAYTLTEGEFVYSSVAYLGDGVIAIAYEPTTQHDRILFTKITINQIKEGN